MHKYCYIMMNSIDIMWYQIVQSIL